MRPDYSRRKRRVAVFVGSELEMMKEEAKLHSQLKGEPVNILSGLPLGGTRVTFLNPKVEEIHKKLLTRLDRASIGLPMCRFREPTALDYMNIRLLKESNSTE